MRFFNILNSILIVLVILGVMGVLKNVVNIKKIQNRLFEAEDQVLGLESKKGELLVDKESKRTDYYLEQEIRNKLRMVKPGENLVVLPKELMDKSEDEIYKYGIDNGKKEKKEMIFEKWVEILK